MEEFLNLLGEKGHQRAKKGIRGRGTPDPLSLGITERGTPDPLSFLTDRHRQRQGERARLGYKEIWGGREEDRERAEDGGACCAHLRKYKTKKYKTQPSTTQRKPKYFKIQNKKM